MCSRRRFLLFLFLANFFLSTHTTDIISTFRTVIDSNNNTIISPGGAFALGFISLGSSRDRYLGIWYNKIKENTLVWIANKDNPIKDRSGVLTVVQPGRLLLLNATNASVWSANISGSVQNPVARLLDSGNLVVSDANDQKPENFIWQSFEYPTDTLLPGMKLGWNFRTGHEVYLTSATNYDNPATGNFTYHCDHTGYPQNVIKEGGSVRFKTGPWNGVHFSGSFNLKKFIFDGVVIDKDEVYYHYDLLNQSEMMRFTLNEGGSGILQKWSYETEKWIAILSFPVDSCDRYKICGSNGFCEIKDSPNSHDCSCLNEFHRDDRWDSGDFTNGCIRSTPLNCEKGDVFFKYSGVKLPDTEESWYNETMTLQDCEAACSLSCSCTVYAPLDISNGEHGCLLWFGDLNDMRMISSGQDVYIRRAGSESGSKSKKRVLISTLLVTGIVLMTLSMLVFIKKRKKLNHQKQQGTDKLRQNRGDLDNPSNESREELELPMLELSTITKATDEFSMKNKLGEGGFGYVYKGVLEEGQEIAVKRLSKTSLQGADEFRNEVICIAKHQHRNLVKLLACCIQGEERILVYEYMTNRSLDSILFDQVKSKILDWPKRFNIINGIARGLMYLHHDSRLRVIHRDLKTSNILLDSHMNPKISDFGLARTFGGDETGANTRRVVGTYGYMSPEYAAEGIFSVKSDVFSFGVLLLEIISGKRNRGYAQGDHRYNLLGHAWVLYKEERELELVDSFHASTSHLSEIVRTIHVGLLCVQECPEDRPNTSSVVLMLNNDGVLPEAKHPGFFVGRDVVGPQSSASSNTASSGNEMTISLLEAR